MSREREFGGLLAKSYAFLASHYSVHPTIHTCITSLSHGATAAGAASHRATADSHPTRDAIAESHLVGDATANSHPACDGTADCHAASPTMYRSSSSSSSSGTTEHADDFAQGEGRYAAAGAWVGGRDKKEEEGSLKTKEAPSPGLDRAECMNVPKVVDATNTEKKESSSKGFEGVGCKELPGLVVAFDSEEKRLQLVLQCAEYTEVSVLHVLAALRYVCFMCWLH
ncbi:unnamed protein product [Closterium sp. NIES-54]